MGNYGKGLTLAFFITVACFCHAEEAESAKNAESVYPSIARLDWRDEGYKRFIAEVETNRRKVFIRDRGRQGGSRDSAQTIADVLTLYRYIPREGENIFSIAARCSIPYSTLASLNRLNNEAMLETDKPILIPSTPGIFVPEKPDSDFEYLLVSSRFPPEEDESGTLTIFNETGNGGIAFHFFPGGEFNATERAFFLNRGFRFPLRSYRLTSSYGMRKNPVTGNMRFHQGLDLAAPAGTEVYAAGNGIVTEVGNDPIYGIYIIIKHNDNWASLYGHLQKALVSLRMNVKSGILIGLVGSTGQSTGPHLHFELRQNGKARDPDKYLFLPGGR